MPIGQIAQAGGVCTSPLAFHFGGGGNGSEGRSCPVARLSRSSDSRCDSRMYSERERCRRAGAVVQAASSGFPYMIVGVRANGQNSIAMLSALED
jgi:hypothetical protein